MGRKRKRASELNEVDDANLRGKLAAYETLVGRVNDQLQSIRERRSQTRGGLKASKEIGALLIAMIVPIRQAVEAEKLEPDEGKLRREVIQQAHAVVEKYRATVEAEMVRLEGEGRALQIQLETIGNLGRAAEAESVRFAAAQDQQDELRKMREPPEEDTAGDADSA